MSIKLVVWTDKSVVVQNMVEMNLISQNSTCDIDLHEKKCWSFIKHRFNFNINQAYFKYRFILINTNYFKTLDNMVNIDIGLSLQMIGTNNNSKSKN